MSNGKIHQLEHTTSLVNEIQTFSADFTTTAHIEHTDRNGMVEMYGGKG